MKSFIRVRFMALLIGLVILLWITTGLTQSSEAIDNKVIITIAGEEHHYIPRPELGYVVRIRQEDKTLNAELQISKETLLLPENAQPIGGLEHHGIWIVENKQSVKQVQNTKTLFGETVGWASAHAEISYLAPLYSNNDETVVVIPEIVVRGKPGTKIEQVETLCDIIGCSIIKPMEFTTQEYLLEVLGPDAEAVFRATEQLNNIPFVEWACPNIASQPKLGSQTVLGNFAHDELLLTDASVQDANEFGVFPNDEYFSEQWYLYNTGQICRYGTGGIPNADINAPEAWEITTGDPNITIAVIDTGVDRSHPDLINNLVPGYDFVEDDNLPDPTLDYWHNAHGTGCAGLIAAKGNNNIGVSGVTWNCKIMPIRIWYYDTQGNEHFTTDSDRATAFRWAASNGADILSNSWYSFQNPHPIIYSAIKDVTVSGGMGREGKGCIVLFCSGNEGQAVTYPAKYPEVIAVGATNHKDEKWFYSNWGSELDIVAPGGGLTVADISGGFLCTTDISGSYGVNYIGMPAVYGPIVDLDMDYRYFGGTSSATPVAAGVAALILSIEPNLTNEEVKHFLERSAKDLGNPGKDDYYGWGRVDAKAALDMILAKRCDLNNNWKVDVDDILILLNCWNTNDPIADVAPAAKRDGVVDIYDFELMLQYWQTDIPEPGLIAHWKLDEAEGDIAYDCINHRDGTLMNWPAWQLDDGMVDGSIDLDGIDDYVSTPFVGNPADGPFSIFAWVKGSVPGEVILSQIGYKNLLSIDSSSGYLMAEIKGDSRMIELVSETVITDGNWHHVGLVWDGSYRTLYGDDVIAAQDTSSQNNFTGSTNGLYIGAGKGLESDSFWTGMIDDVRIYDQVIIP